MCLDKPIVEDAALEWFRRRHLLLRGYDLPFQGYHLLRQGYVGQEGYGGHVGELGYAVGDGAAFAKLRQAKPHLAPGEPAAEWDSIGEVVLVERQRQSIRRLNPGIPEEALREILRLGTPSLIPSNRGLHFAPSDRQLLMHRVVDSSTATLNGSMESGT